MTNTSFKTGLILKTAKMFIPAILGAIGGVAATAFPTYFNSFCGL